MRWRWIIVVTAEDGASEAFGPWSDIDKADKHADQLRRRSSRYAAHEHDAAADFSVQVLALKRWPGIREYMRSFR
jgi:hypothetical protein